MLKTVLLICIAMAVAYVSAGGKGGGKMGQMMMNLTCKGESLNMKDMMEAKKKCFEEVAGTVTETDAKKKKSAVMEKIMCVHVCHMKKEKVLNEDGTYNSAAAETMIKKYFPAAVQADMKKAFDECNTANSATFSMENNCAGYKAFYECKAKKFMEICEIKMPEGGEQQS